MKVPISKKKMPIYFVHHCRFFLSGNNSFYHITDLSHVPFRWVLNHDRVQCEKEDKQSAQADLMQTHHMIHFGKKASRSPSLRRCQSTSESSERGEERRSLRRGQSFNSDH